ncbi:hypothetical protein AC1031_015165 [Aphanomyces cochlioides]|nr:hypothetical protein AC1031_015165 [Aphanomyces cochlioides]
METLLNLPQFDNQDVDLIDCDALSITIEAVDSIHESNVQDVPIECPDYEIEATATAPSSSCFPQLSCRQAWTFWFHGDARSGLQPLRTLGVADFENNDARRRWWIAKQVMTELTDTALKHDFVPTKETLANLPRDDLLSVFESAFAKFTAESRGENQRPFTPDSDCSEALERIFHTRASKKAPKRFVRGGVVPSLPLREMWRLWFNGEGLSHGIPYQRYRQVCNRKIRHETSRVMKRLAELAVKEMLVPSTDALETMSGVALLDAFDVIFPVFHRQFEPTAQRVVHPGMLCTGRVWSESPDDGENNTQVAMVRVPGDFPSGTARELWPLWFHGNEASKGVPYRRTVWSGRHDVRRRTRVVMMKMEECVAVLVGSMEMLEKMPLDELMEIFDDVFDEFVAKYCPACPDSLNKMCTTLYAFMMSHRKAKQNLDVYEHALE